MTDCGKSHCEPKAKQSIEVFQVKHKANVIQTAYNGGLIPHCNSIQLFHR